MPWYAQREGLPDSHKLWADPGSRHEAVLKAIGFVEVPAPGAGQSTETRPGFDENGEPCVCQGGWSVDENWSPAYPELWKGERSPGDGMIPCGFCNEGNWDAPWPPEPPEPVAAEVVAPKPRGKAKS